MTGSDRIVAVIGIATALAWPSLALASDAPDQALAQSLFDEAVRLMEQSRYAEACPKLAESQRLDPGGGTLLNLGLCREKEGKLATAWTIYNDALSQAIKDKRQDREMTARERIAVIGPNLAKFVIEVDPATAKLEGLEVTLDGARVGRAAWGLATPIDAGAHTVAVGALGKRPWQTPLEVKKDGDQVRVSVPALQDAPKPTVEGPTTQAGGNGTRTAAFVVGGVGAAALVVGSIGGVMAIVKRGDSNAECPGNQCTVKGVALNEDAKTFAWVANIGVGVGVVALGAATIMWFVGKPQSSPTAARLVPTVGPSGGGLSLSGQF
jgi:hypothetical protein